METDIFIVSRNEFVFILCLVSSSVTFIFVKRLIRPLFPVTVSCWFCDFHIKVPFGNQNCWDCPQCEQYNGFTKDGDYNKPIPAQYQEDLNHLTGCRKAEFLTKRESLCAKCMENQSAKVRQLAHFEPSNERNFDVEVEALQKYQEEVYRLCSTCQKKVDKVIQEKDQTIWSRLNDSLRSKLSFLHAEKNFRLISPFLEMNNNRLMMASYFLHALEVLSSLGLLLRQIQLDTDQTNVLQTYFPELSVLHPVLLSLDRNVWHLVLVLILSGILAKVLVTTNRILKVDFINSVFLLMVLFTQCDIFNVFGMGSPLEVAVFVMCHLTSVFCLLIGRKTQSPLYVMESRNIRPVERYRRSSASSWKLNTHVPGSKLSTSDSTSNLSIFSTKQSEKSPSHSTVCPSPCEDDFNRIHAIDQEQNDGQNVNYSYTVFKLESCNLGYEPLNQSGSQFRSRSSSLSSQKSSRSSYASTLSAQTMSGSRPRNTRSPLISPSRFTAMPSTPKTQQSQCQYGLFSVRPVDKDHNIFHSSSTSETYTSLQTVANTALSQGYPRSLSTPPVVTRFGAPPYSMTLMSDDHRTHSNTYESKGFDLENSSLHRSDSFKYLRDVKEESDEEEEDCDELSDTDSIVSDSDSGIDSVSHFTSVSHQMTDHSLTTVTGTPVRRKKRLFPWVLTALTICLLMIRFPDINMPVVHTGLTFL